MNYVTLIALVGGIVGLLGGICGIVGLFYAKKQTRLMQQQVESVFSQDQSYAEWSVMLEQAITGLTKIYAGRIRRGNYANPVLAKTIVFSADTRERIERHLGQASKWSGRFHPTPLSRDQLRSPIVQGIIQEVLVTVENFKREHPDWAREIKLLPPS